MTPTPRNRAGSNPLASWVRPLILGASCLVLGFVIGWVLHSGGGGTATLPAVSPNYLGTATQPPARGRTVTGAAGGRTATGSATAAGTTGTAAAATGTTAAAPPRPDRSQVAVAVLNGTTTAGLAGRKADQLRALGYGTVGTGNAPSGSGPSVVYHRPGARAAAEQAAADLGIRRVEALPAAGPIASAAATQASAQVIVVLHAG